MPKRIRLTFFMIIGLFCLLVARLAFIQIINGHDYEEAALSQYKFAFQGSDERGTVYDRYKAPLTGIKKDYVFIVEKNKVDGELYRLMKRAKYRKIPAKNSTYAVFAGEIFEKELAVQLEQDYDAFIMEATKRYEENQPAVHLIGYINEIDGKGIVGLEKDYDKYLTKRSKEIYGFTDASGHILRGKGITIKEKNKESGVITTLDKNLQQEAETILSKSGHNGAIIVTEVERGEVLVCASSPKYNPVKLKKYLKSNKMEFVNKPTQGLYPPGSIFKIVVAAAALEEGVVMEDTPFFCKGYEIINGVRINCSKKEGHGELTFKEGFAKSCNSVFIQTGIKVGSHNILAMAERMKLNEKALPNISGEKNGIFPEEKDTHGAGIGNLSIGQGELAFTPMAVARATMIVANKGVDKGLYVVKGILDQGRFTEEKRPANEVIFSQELAERLGKIMEETAGIGTASRLNVESYSGKKIKIACKTGSAETSLHGKYTVHGWLTGFLPAEMPEYVITVFAEGGGEGQSASLPMFEEMAKTLVIRKAPLEASSGAK